MPRLRPHTLPAHTGCTCISGFELAPSLPLPPINAPLPRPRPPSPAAAGAVLCIAGPAAVRATPRLGDAVSQEQQLHAPLLIQEWEPEGGWVGSEAAAAAAAAAAAGGIGSGVALILPLPH